VSEHRAGAVAPSTRGVENQALCYSSAGGQGGSGSLREQMVAAAAPESKRTVDALCDLRQMHLSEFADGRARET